MTSKKALRALDAAAFNWKQTALAPTNGEGGVVLGIDVTAILHDAATECVVGLFGTAAVASLSHLVVRPVLRAISAAFEGPLAPGTQIVVGVTLSSLSERSFSLTTAVWRAEDSLLVAHGSANFVVVDVESGRAVAVPGNVVDGLRRLLPLPPLAESSQPTEHADISTS